MDFDPAGKRLAFGLQTPAQPSDVCVWTLADGGFERWTESEIGPVDAKSLLAPTLVRFPTFDKVDGKPREIPAWVYKPAGAGPHPVLISIHGGPESQSQPVFSITTQQWAVELGYAVIHPNVRGSSGYGKTYLALDNGMKREDSVKDIGALLDWIATQPDLDAKRVVVIGGSYGGYMVACVHDPLQRPAARRGRHRRHQQLRHLPREHGGVPARPAPARVRRRARPEDARVPAEDLAAQQRGQDHASRCWSCRARTTRACRYTEAEQMVAKIRANGGEVWYLVGLNEGHGFQKRDNIDYYQWTVAMFLEKLKQ